MDGDQTHANDNTKTQIKKVKIKKGKVSIHASRFNGNFSVIRQRR
jgi:hypothetical protein